MNITFQICNGLEIQQSWYANNNGKVLFWGLIIIITTRMRLMHVEMLGVFIQKASVEFIRKVTNISVLRSVV